MVKSKYLLYLASGIKLWQDYFKETYSKHFNRKLSLFEPGNMELQIPTVHKNIPIKIACHVLDKINHSDALLVYMKHYKTPDNSPAGTDSTWECGYTIGKGKPVIMLIEDKEHIDYYANQWMVTFSINAIITTKKEVAEIVKNHPKFVHTTILLAQNPEQFETKIIEYLNNYYRSIYSRSGIINYHVDNRARNLFNRENLGKLVFVNNKPDVKITKALKLLENLSFKSDKDSLKVCTVERNISKYLANNISEKTINSAISAVLKSWKKPENYILDCLEHSIKPPFEKVKGRKHGIKKTRSELFFELYDLVNHHLVKGKRFIKSETFPYEVGAIIELYNWMNTYALDDVFDNSRLRQNLKTVWNNFTRRDAIYTGIIGHLLALKYILAIASENEYIAKTLAGIMNNYNHTMYQGQVLDLMLTFDSANKKELLKRKKLDEAYEIYIQRIYGICGGFYEAIGELASKAGNKEEQITNPREIDETSSLIGMYYGIIQMIRNDLGDYVIVEKISKLSKGMKGISHSDVIEGKADIAYLIAIHSPYLNKTEKDFLLNKLYTRLTKKDKLKINQLLWKSGAIDLVVDLLINLIEHVEKNLLSKYHETPTRMKWMFNLLEITKTILVPFEKQAFQNKWVKYEYNPSLLKKLTEMIIELENKSKNRRLDKLQEFNSMENKL